MKNKTLKVSLAVFSTVFFVILILLSPFMEVSTINISGNKKLSNDYILNQIKLNDNSNLMAFSTRKAEKVLITDPYVKSVSFKKNFFTKTINLTIEERQIAGYVEYMPGNFLYIDHDGFILEARKDFKENLPIIIDMELEPFTVGKLLQVPSEKSLEILTTLTHLFRKYELETKIVKLSLKEKNNTRLYVNNIIVELGDIKDADEKIRTLKAILENLNDDNIKGFLDLKDVNKPASLKKLT